MYSLFAKKDSAHEDAIWTCVWGRRPERTETEEVEVEVEVEEEEVIVGEILVQFGYCDTVGTREMCHNKRMSQ